jgi:ACS family tartrate transporter-like MFS transporter
LTRPALSHTLCGKNIFGFPNVNIPNEAAADPSAIISKVTRRIVPYIFLCYIVNYLDRFNVSFAALQMSSDLGFSEMVYGLGASMFFVGYVFFEIPSNLIMQKVGARVWIARIMISWGVVSTCMMLVKSAAGFYSLRFLLGVAEAGFFPGMILYLTYWIPATERARAFALFLTSTSLAGVIGGPVSGALFRMEGMYGLKGWQWLFLMEGIPAVLLGCITLLYLVDRPDQARWLSPADRDWLSRVMDKENENKRLSHGWTLRQALTHPKVWQLCLLYFSIIISFYGVAFWLPQVVKSFSGLDNTTVATLSSLPYVAASIAMVLVANHSDRTGERRWHVAMPAFSGALGLGSAVFFLQHQSPWLAFISICVAASGIWSTLGPFWSLPTAFLSGTAAAGGVALINSVGNVGGFVGPYVVGYVRETTQSFTNGMLVLAATLLVAGFLALRVRE